ncbi:MAG: hypothetical protein IPL49_19165 [Saprospirales bacterium]|nr:hypothetical protein [Saprospirales bacterium]
MNNSTYNMKYFLGWVLLLLLNPSSQAFYGKYPIQNFTPTDYKAGIQNIDFAQNRDMTLFVANNLGVLSFNGNDWETHRFKTGKKKRSLAFDEHTNRLYVGSQGEIGFLEADWNYVSLTEKIPAASRDFDEVWEVFLFNSKVYFCTFQGIYVYDGQSFSVIAQEDGLERSFNGNGKLFTQSKQGRLLEIKDLALVPTYPQRQHHAIIAGIIPQDEGYLLFYNSGEIEFSTPFGVAEKYTDLIEALQGTYVNHVLQLSDTRLAISTQRAGLFLYDLQKQTLTHITKQDGLQTNACLRTFQDYAGNLWVGMQTGIALIDINSPMRLINQDINLQGSGYEAYEVEAGTYYTTSNGIYFLAKNAPKCVFLKGTEGPAYGIQKITGKLYAGHHTGLFLLEGDKAKRLAVTNGLWQVKQLRSNPEFAIGGTYSGLYLFRIDKNLELQAVQKISGFSESSRFFEEDQYGRIWVGQFYKGLYQLDLSEGLTKATATKVSAAEDLPIDDQIILSRIDNELYLATKAGVYKVDQTTGQIVTAGIFSKDIGTQPVYLLGQDNQKNIYVFAENTVGFFRQISANNYVFVRSSLLQLRYSFNNDLLNVSVNTSEGVLFNANEGFIHYSPELENRVKVEGPLVISKAISVAEDSILYTLQPFEAKSEKIKKLDISPRAKVLQFDVESFQFNEVNNQHFRYYLKGFDAAYGDWTPTKIKEYTNLKEGEYEFTVQTRNYLGETITSQPLLLNVKPPFHRSLFAKFLYVLLGIFTLFQVSRFQKRRFIQEAKKIEKAKQQALAEKQQKLIEIEQQKAQELLQLEEDKIKSELRHTNNLLAASTMNLVVKNEFIETIKEKLKEVNRKGKNRETQEALEQLVKEIDTTLRLQEDWEQFEHHFDRVHGNFLSRLRDEFLDLSPNEQKLAAFLRLNLNTKEIANLMGISLRGVEVARYRLRKKLGLNKGDNLSKFILEY